MLKPLPYPRCGEANPATGKFCYKCGSYLTLEEALKGEKEKTDEVEVLKRQMANLKQALIDMQRIISHLSGESDKGGDKGWKNGKPLRG